MHFIGIADTEFIRGNIPMTKEEVRILTLAKAKIKADDIIIDIGAGTGSLSIEAALLAPKGKVFALEKNLEGIDLIKKNAENGDAKAQYDLALIYEYGKEVLTDKNQALYWYEKSANHNFAPAQFVVGSAYEMGKGVIKNRELMQQWYDKFCKNGLCKL